MATGRASTTTPAAPGSDQRPRAGGPLPATADGIRGPGRPTPVLGGRRIIAITAGGGAVRAQVDGSELHRMAVAVTSRGVLVGASSGHARRDGRIYRFDGARFEPAEGLPDRLDGAIETRHLAARRDDAALVTPDGSLYSSDDGGRRWSRTGDGPVPPTAEVAFEPGSTVEASS